MAVYVDRSLWPYRHMIMCHLLADTAEELHALAEQIGMKRQWVQRSSHGILHYDICKAKRKKAVAAGAIELDRKGLIVLMKKQEK